MGSTTGATTCPEAAYGLPCNTQSGSGASAPSTSLPQAPSVSAPAVQTPTITNAPSSNGQGQTAPTNLQQRAQQYLQRQRSGKQSGTEQAQPLQPYQQLEKQRASHGTAPANPFQSFIAESTGQRLPMFGYDFFQGAPSTFAPVENIPVTPDHVIGPGDQLIIRAWDLPDYFWVISPRSRV